MARYVAENGKWVLVDSGPTSMPDVYFKGPYFDPNLGDPNDPKKSRGQWIYSRQQKVREMQRMGLQESGDRVHGARTEFRPYGPSQKIFFQV